MDRPPPSERRLLARQAIALACVLGVAALLSDEAAWADRSLLITLGAVAIGSHLLRIEGRGIHVSGSFMGLVLAMALLGPTPAVVIGVAAVLLDGLRTRPPAWHLATDLLTYATFPLIGGLLFKAVHATGADTEPVGLATAVGVVFVVTNLVNFVLVVEQTRMYRAGLPSLRAMVRGNFVPLLPWQLAAALVTAVAAYGQVKLGLGAVGLLVLMMAVFQLLLRAVMAAENRRDELAARLDQLGEMHQGLLAVMLQTLGLRDNMTARHSAAVARYTRAVAEAGGLSEAECDLAHTAGLLHDIGKSAFDDDLLRTAGRLDEEQWARIRRHPEDGARILEAVRGYEEVAHIVLHHHERWDGAGYPAGLIGEEIPHLSRIIAVADTYDVMTARDSYRRPISHDEAVAELRRVAGTQLDPRYVELFLGVLDHGGVAFGHADDHDLHEELRRPPAAMPGFVAVHDG